MRLRSTTRAQAETSNKEKMRPGPRALKFARRLQRFAVLSFFNFSRLKGAAVHEFQPF